MTWILSPARSVDRTCCGESLPRISSLRRRSRRLDAVVERLAELEREIAVDLAGIAVQPGHDLRREQRRDDSVLVRRPHAAVQANERRARALFAAEAERAVEQAAHEPL